MKKVKKQRSPLLPLIYVDVILVLITLLGYIEGLILYFLIAFISIIIVCLLVITILIKKNPLLFWDKRVKKSLKIFGITINMISIFSIATIAVPFVYSYVTFDENKAEKEMKQTVTELTRGLSENMSKVRAILNWFDWGEGKKENMANMYHRRYQKDVITIFSLKDTLALYSKFPYIIIRDSNPTKNWHRWIFYSRGGECGEYARLFSYMCYYANITVKEIHCVDDHAWDEVYINDSWIVVDPTAVCLPNDNGTAFNRTFMEAKIAGEWAKLGHQYSNRGNVSYVYSITPVNMTPIDETKNYSGLIHLSISIINLKGVAIENATVKIFSHNRYEQKDSPIDTTLSNLTNDKGVCNFTLGGGDYTFKVQKENLHGEIRKSFAERPDVYEFSIVIQ